MKNRTVALITSILVLIITTAFITYAVIKANLMPSSDAIPYGLSILAFFISILSSFREELFPFQLTVFADGLTLVAAGSLPPASGITLMVLLPITFSNIGYREGVIQSIKLVVKNEENKGHRDFLPGVEVDMALFMQQMKGINATNSVGNFAGFVLEPKKTIRKNLVFSARVDPEQKSFVWQPDTYIFELYAKVYGDKKFRKYFELKQKIASNALSMLATGKSKVVYFMDSQS
jgi:hypothetical protein